MHGTGVKKSKEGRRGTKARRETLIRVLLGRSRAERILPFFFRYTERSSYSLSIEATAFRARRKIRVSAELRGFEEGGKKGEKEGSK